MKISSFEFQGILLGFLILELSSSGIFEFWKSLKICILENLISSFGNQVSEISSFGNQVSEISSFGNKFSKFRFSEIKFWKFRISEMQFRKYWILEFWKSSPRIFNIEILNFYFNFNISNIRKFGLHLLFLFKPS